MKAKIVIAIVYAFVGISGADTIFVKPEEQILIDRIRPTSSEPSEADVVAASSSPNPLVQLEGFKAIFHRRDFQVWKNVKSKIASPKGTCAYLAPILDQLSKSAIEDYTALITALKPEQLALLSLKDEAEPPRYEDSEPPIDKVLYAILADDLSRQALRVDDRKQAARLLGKYRAPTKLLGDSITAMAESGKPGSTK